MKLWVPITILAALAAFLLAFGPPTRVVTVTKTTGRVLTVYVKNDSPKYFSNKQIRRDIPAWEKAANKDFAPIWGTPQVRIVLGGKAPKGAIVAIFRKSGPIQGALAYHTVLRGAPEIIVYAGVGDFYGYDNSVSFTHELFETLADQTTSQINGGWAPDLWLGQTPHSIPSNVYFINEVCDPVEAYWYGVDGVEISDFITPNWFADGVNGGYDFMQVVQRPYQIVRGGYVIFTIDHQWGSVTFFDHFGRDPAGFMKGEREASSL